MHDARFVVRMECFRNLREYPDRPVERPRSAVELLAQRLAVLDVLHDKKRASVELSGVVDREDVRMVEAFQKG